MGQMDALTAMELEAARRREIVIEDLVDARLTRHGRTGGRTGQRREPAWLVTALTALAGMRLVRG
jgi:hypothetical protein